MKKVYLINGSPRGTNSASQYFIDEVCKLLDKEKIEIEEISIIDFRKSTDKEKIYTEVINSDNIIFTFPLYVDSLPSIVIEFLIGFENFIKNRENFMDVRRLPRVYAIVNCGFFEGQQNRYAVQIMKNFCDKVHFTWRFGIGIGAGEFMRETQNNIPLNKNPKQKIYKALQDMKEDIENNVETPKNNIFESPQFPKFLFKFMGNRGWIKMGKLNKISKKQLYAKPYAK